MTFKGGLSYISTEESGHFEMRLPSSEFIKHLMLFFLLFNLILFIGITLLIILKVNYEEYQSITGILTILAFPLAISIFFLLVHISRTRKATPLLKQKPKRLLRFITNQSPQSIIEHVAFLARTVNYTIEDINESKGRIILGSSFNWTSWGFFYPIYTSLQNDGKTLVEVGIKSRLYQYGPLVTRAHKKFYNKVKNAILTNIEPENAG